jgi:hypothetical protein
MSRVGAQRAHDAKAYRSGFCGRGNPAKSHEHCPAEYQGRPCVCDCHTTTEIRGEAGPEQLGLLTGQQVAPLVVGSAIPDDPTGFHADVPEQEYFAHQGSLSVSGAKLILKAPALYRHEQTHKTFKRVWDVGSGAHKIVLGVGPDLVVVQQTKTDRKGEIVEIIDAPDYRSTSAQEHRDQIRAAGGTPLLRSEYVQVHEMADALSGNSLAMELLGEGQPEVSAFCEDEETGVMRRGRFDWLAPLILSDLKSTINANPNGLARTIVNLNYHMAAAWYLQLARDLGHPAQAFALIFLEKEPPFLSSVVELDQDALDLGARRNREALAIYAECMKTGIWPGYQRPGEWKRISLPRWAFTEEVSA